VEIDWQKVGADLDERGSAVVARLMSPAQCRSLIGLYDKDDIFRNRVVMARHNFGRGEYKYFAYPLPEVLATLRTDLYPPLAEIANRWNAALGIDARFPREHKAYQALPRCRTAQADAAHPQVRGGRLQLPAPGSLRRARLSLAAHHPALGA
jgi:hypothetical protein